MTLNEAERLNSHTTMAKSDIENTQDSNAIGVVVQCPCSAWRLHHKQRPTDGQLIVVVNDNKWRAGHVTKRGSYDYLNTGDGAPRMITYGAQWMPIDQPNDKAEAPSLSEVDPPAAG